MNALSPRAPWLGQRWACALAISLCAGGCAHPPPPARAHTAELGRIDDTVRRAMAATGARGLAIAVVDGGQVVFTNAYGVRDASAAPLREDTVMYGASLTKAAFGYLVMQLVDEGRLGLDVPIAQYLPQPLPSYASADIVRRYSAFAGLAGDERWRKLTAAHAADAQRRLLELLLPGARPAVAHPLRTRQPLRLLGRRDHPAAVRAGAGAGHRRGRRDEPAAVRAQTA